MTTETKTADTILEDAGVAYVALYAGETKRDGWECDAWRITFTRDTPFHTETFDYFTGLGLRGPAPKPTDGGPAPFRNTLMWAELEAKRKPIVPSADSVLSCLARDAIGSESTFEDWANEYGYDTDSRKALATYMECQETATKLRKVGLRDFEALAELDN